jgi:hypothetical protein
VVGNVQGGAVPGGESRMFHDRDIPVSVRRDVRRLGPRNLSASGSAVPGDEREETGKAGDVPESR